MEWLKLAWVAEDCVVLVEQRENNQMMLEVAQKYDKNSEKSVK